MPKKQKVHRQNQMKKLHHMSSTKLWLTEETKQMIGEKESDQKERKLGQSQAQGTFPLNEEAQGQM
jgi:hypothetical protein